MPPSERSTQGASTWSTPGMTAGMGGIASASCRGARKRGREEERNAPGPAAAAADGPGLVHAEVRQAQVGGGVPQQPEQAHAASAIQLRLSLLTARGCCSLCRPRLNRQVHARCSPGTSHSYHAGFLGRALP